MFSDIIGLNPIFLALLGTTFTFFATAVGAAMVYLMKKDVNPNVQHSFLGFAAGVMIAASVWSLLIPAIEMAEEQGISGWIPSAGGFVIGGIFLFILDKLLPHLHIDQDKPEGLKSSFKRTTMLVLAVTLHNIPEGMAVGLSFGLAGQLNSQSALMSSVALAIGIGIQNFPEGAAISLPLRNEGFSKNKSFVFGALSGIVEPIGGVISAFLVSGVTGIMPWMLSFAAGAMIYVVSEELIPESQSSEHSHAGTIGTMLGFVVMMVLDVALS
ncbi:MAG: ZIP family metal transporter [Sedimentibacter sp.]|uniref:ZIP family metal transporter n=1 Tax=Sedimentibacter sp. TaxID=1960295 RepID=UPI00298217E1|nr:ZIP family metal transporter [Sedimentibacter sp.]MDW5299939.1 ZIP family metal transporter [Sedimentibacter sp.]